MNLNKKDNSGWILCPSKSFPGKFYYFNVLNGGAAWSLNDADQKAMRRDLQKADKSHSFPEPLGPPMQSPTTNIGLNIQKPVPNIVRSFNNMPQTTPTFGQAAFPTYISNVDPYTLNLLWAPMVPMLPKLWQGQSTPTCDSTREIFVQTCDIPLSKRFINYEGPKTILEPSSSIKFFDQSRENCDPVIQSSSNLLGDSPILGQMIHNQENYSINKLGRPRMQSESDNVGTFFDHNERLRTTSRQIFDVAGKNSNVESIKKVKRLRTLSGSDSVLFEKPDQLNPTLNQSLINQSSQNGESSEANIQSKSSFVLRKSLLNLNQIKSTGQLENEEKDNQNKKNINEIDSSLGNLEKNDWGENKKAGLLGNLDENDLRHTLVKKRRKCIDLGITNHVEENRYKVPAINKHKEPVKKRVMFNIDSTEESYEENEEYDDSQPQVTIHTLRGLVDSINGQWYVAVDSRVLLDDYDFIEKFVKLDNECRLFVPHVVKLEIEDFCFGDCRGQQRVIVARQLTRRLAMPPPYIVVQPAQNEDKVFTTMSTIVRILNSCIEILQQRDHVVLVTDDSVLYEKAKSLKIHCFKLKEIKDDACQNLSLEKESNPFSNINRKITVDNSKKTFNNNTKNCDLLTDVKNTTDANTSPINFEGTILKRKEKSRDYLNFNYDSDSDGSVISKTIGNLKIRDKNSNFLHKNSNDNKLDDRKSNSFTFQIKNKKNIMPEKEQKSSQLQNSKKEAFSEPKQDFQLQIQNKSVAGQKEIQTKSETVTSKVEQFKKSIGDNLKQRFQVKSKFMEENIRSNIDEWICTFRQIMEDALSEYLQVCDPPRDPPTLPPPWTLHEAVTCVRRVHAGRGGWRVTAVADELSMLLLNNCCKRGELKRDIKPEEFLRVFGCGAILLELLADPPPHDGRRQLREMFSQMLQTEDVDLIRTPVRRDDGDEPVRHNFPKKSTDIIQYLKNHFPAWRVYVEPTRDEVITQNDKKIVRTFGRNLNLLTIDKSKSMTLRESPDKTNDDKEISKQSSEINLSENTLIDSQSTVKLNDSNEPKIIRRFDTSTPFNNKVPQANNTTTQQHNISLTPKHGNTFDNKETGGPKVVRNIKLIDEFEKKLKSKANDEECNSNESFSLSDVSLCSSVDRNNKVFDHNNDVISINDKNSFNDCKEQNNDKPNGSSTNDSEFENETDTYTVVQTFLSELSGSLKLIYGFIDDSMAEFRKKELENDKRKSIFDKASVTQLHLSGIIYKLKRIVERESNEVTPLKEFILKADMLVAGDIRLMKYKQVVMKCLEQAQLLESALKILLGISEGDYDVTNCTDRQTFLNIFE